MLQNSSGHNSPTMTSASLILRIQAHDAIAWERFARLYTPYVYGLCRANGLQKYDAEDVSQNVLKSVITGIETYQRTGSFRGWISQITRNRIIDYHRRQQRQPLALGGTDMQIRMADLPEELSASSAGCAADRDLLVMQALNLIRNDFEESTWIAFWRMVVEHDSAVEIARDLGWIDPTEAESLAKATRRVRQAKYRVMQRLREEFGEVLDL